MNQALDQPGVRVGEAQAGRAVFAPTAEQHEHLGVALDQRRLLLALDAAKLGGGHGSAADESYVAWRFGVLFTWRRGAWRSTHRRWTRRSPPASVRRWAPPWGSSCAQARRR